MVLYEECIGAIIAIFDIRKIVAFQFLTRRWKDHFKSDFRSDQDHFLEK
jgi:hypothetical protein